MNGHHNVLEAIAPALTYGGATSAVTMYGLSLGDMGVIVSMVCAVIGVGLQIYVAREKVRAIRRETQRDVTEARSK